MNNRDKVYSMIAVVVLFILIMTLVFVVAEKTKNDNLRNSETYQTLATNWPLLSLEGKDALCAHYDDPELSRAIVSEVFKSKQGIDSAQLFLEDVCENY